MRNIGRFSFGIGDRFGHEGLAQLEAFQAAERLGIEITPVWNKSYREHMIIHTDPVSVRLEADAAVSASGWQRDYFVDADHIGLKNVDLFIESADFFTLDVAEQLGGPIESDEVEAFIVRNRNLLGTIDLPGNSQRLSIDEGLLRATAVRYLPAVKEAAAIYRHIAERKDPQSFVTEVSMDETEQPQSPEELFIILAAIAQLEIPARTIAPKFSGRFNKGIDYVGDPARFEREFNADLAVAAYAPAAFGLPDELKLSVHSGSDKFTIFPIINRAMYRSGAGIHVKTAGTTWLEEVIGLSEAGGSGLKLVKEVYRSACGRYEELTGPYSAVIAIDRNQLPAPDQLDTWSSSEIVAAVRHIPDNPAYSPHIRQLFHVGYKAAAEMGSRFTSALEEWRTVVARNVTENLFERHIRPLFGKPE